MGKTLTDAQALADTKPTCGACMHYQAVEDDWGSCKHSPPQSAMLEDDNGDTYQVTFWPQLDREEIGCSQFRGGA